MKGLGWKFARDVFMTGIASLLVIVAPMSWVTGTVAAGIAFLIAGDSGIQYLEALTRYQCGYIVPRVPLKRSHGFDEATVREYNAIKFDYDFEQACVSQMVQLESTLDDARPVIHDVSTKLGALADVRATVRLSKDLVGTNSRLNWPRLRTDQCRDLHNTKFTQLC
ncbi:hypothetical protein BDN67DRAFT_814855 [Paxillus ammoniavirescens]|nr:hypothetical protein BDN67DRAFT_814855 [Paxillus ammoniavirescens]